MNLHDWIDELCDVLDIETEVDEALVLDLAKVAADNVIRPAAPITTYLLGYAAGSNGANAEQTERLAAKAQSLAENWDHPSDAPDPSTWTTRCPTTGSWTTPATRTTSEDHMKAIVVREPGGPEALEYTDVPDPEIGPDDVLIDVAATAVNRADLLQRQGHYNPPPGASEVIGLECSGTIAAVGDSVTDHRVGDQVAALLAGGGYATRVSVPAGQVMPIPDGLDLVTAAALPEVAATVWSNVMMVAGLGPDDTFLVHGGAGGIGTFAIQLAVAVGARVLTTGGSPAKLAFCAELGAEVTIDYREQDFVEVVREVTDGRGVDVILDNMGAAYLGRNVAALAIEGRLVVIGLQGGTKGELDLNALMRKRAAVVATTLRARPSSEKATICRAVVEHVWPLVADGTIRAIIDTTMPLADAAAAHRRMESGEHTGKIVLVT